MTRPSEDLEWLDAPALQPIHTDPLHELSLEQRLYDRHLPFASGLPEAFLRGWP
jgi:hypothetical protein